MENIKEKLSGVFAPMVTPFEDDRILFDGLRSNVEKMNETGLRGYFVLGTNGEYKALSEDERYKVVDTVVRNSSKDKVIMAGTGAESTKLTIELTRRAVDAGAQMVSLLMPHFFTKKIDEDVMVRFITEVADASPVPVALYNNPSVAAGVNITIEVLRRVTSHPNVVGIKDSNKNYYRTTLRAASDDFFVLAGSANYFLDVLKNGGTGGVLSLANVFPNACAELYRLFSEGKTEEAEKLNEKLIWLNREVSGTYSVAGVKCAMDLVGFTGGVPRRPLTGLGENDRKNLEEKLKESGLF
ncbi:MAG: dihydrodipicolinate synthase family protein [Spirochaetes bacterium]|nr:MAG: dihydrodipicolinate synthase family protein [Spirochaetota bacterium]